MSHSVKTAPPRSSHELSVPEELAMFEQARRLQAGGVTSAPSFLEHAWREHVGANKAQHDRGVTRRSRYGIIIAQGGRAFKS